MGVSWQQATSTSELCFKTQAASTRRWTDTAGRSIQERLAHDNPRVTEYQSELAMTGLRIGAVLSRTPRIEDAVKAYRDALDILERLTKENPGVTSYQSQLAVAHGGIGQLLTAVGRPDEALEAHSAALRILERLRGTIPQFTITGATWEQP